MEARTLTIFYTSDIHGKFNDYKIEKIQGLIKNCDTPKILVDGGDILKGGNVIFYPIESTFKYIEKLKYTAICMGNREFNYFRIILYNRIKKYPFLACNVVDKLLKNQIIKPALHIIIDIFRITIIGITKPQYKVGSFWEKITGFRFEDTFLSIKNQIEKYYKITDLFVILSHLGIKDDNILSKFLFENYKNILYKFLILGGHDHQDYHSDQFVPIIHNEPFLKSITQLELVFIVKNNQKYLDNITLSKVNLER